MEEVPTRILVVEDNLGDADLVAEHLSGVPGGNFELVHAKTLAQAQGWLQRDSCDVILLDIGLPDSRGLASLHALQGLAPEIPVIVLTGASDEELAHRALSGKAQDYLVKHEVSSRMLDRAVRYAIERHRAVRRAAELTELNNAKSRFIASFSHELRTPLNAISNYVELLEEEVYGPLGARQRQGVAGIRECAAHLISVINDIIDLSSLEANAIELSRALFDPRGVCEEALSVARSLAKDAPVRVFMDWQAGDVLLTTDRRRLNQILVNLMANAVAFTDEGSVTLRAETRGARFRVSIVDTGVGIEETEFERIFEAFYQVDRGDGRPARGNGLGLHVAARLSHALGATLSVTSRPGEGSTFVLELPRTVPPSRPATEP